eukprot:m.35187 g.35187  ORF g.35187 m.35187 type:complete len:385 (-) comp9991_c0_seq3:112-1266(-)
MSDSLKRSTPPYKSSLKKSKHQQNVCPKHPTIPPVIDEQKGLTVCAAVGCGRVIEENMIDSKSEVRNFGNTDKKKSNNDPNRVGVAENPFSTSTGGLQMSEMYVNGKKVEANWMRSGSQLLGPSDAAKKVFSEINKLAMILQVADVVAATAKKRCKEAMETGELTKKNKILIAAACVFIASREHKAPQSFKDIAAAAGRKQTKIGVVYKIIRDTLKLQIVSATPESFLEQFCSKLHLPHQVNEIAKHILSVTDKLTILEGKRPQTTAAAALYYATQAVKIKLGDKEHNVPLTDISRVSAMSESAIKESYKTLFPFREYLFPSGMKFTNKSLLQLDEFGKSAKNDSASTGWRQLEKLKVEKTHSLVNIRTADELKYEQEVAYKTT